MLTKAQFKFLKKFQKVAKIQKNEDVLLKMYNREKVTVKILIDLLEKHPKLCPAEPFNNESSFDKLTDYELINYLNIIYLPKIGLDKCIEYYQPDKFGISSNGLQLIDNYKLEHTSKLKLPIIAIVISAISSVVAILAFIISVLNLVK